MKANQPGGVTAGDAALLVGAGRDPRRCAVQMACRGYCEYFKGEGGESECGGFRVLLQGLASGRIDPAHIEHVVGKEPMPPRRTGFLVDSLCFRCAYLEGGCDYLSKSPPEDATPCGGYRLLQALLDCGALTPHLLVSIIRSCR